MQSMKNLPLGIMSGGLDGQSWRVYHIKILVIF